MKRVIYHILCVRFFF